MREKDSDCKITREEFQGLVDKIDWTNYVQEVISFQHEIAQKSRRVHADSESRAYTAGYY